MRFSKNTGITLIELLVTLIVSLILIATGIPSMASLIKNNRLTSTSNQMITDLSQARSEAIKRGKQIRLCPANSSLNGCSGSTEWENGWLIFVNSIDIDNKSLDAGEEIVFTRPSRKNVTIRGNNNLSSTACFSPRGVSCHPGSFYICDARNDPNNARRVVLSKTGRTHVSKDEIICP